MNSIKCPKCGCKVTSNMKFCSQCGTNVAKLFLDGDSLLLEAKKYKNTNSKLYFDYLKLASQKKNSEAMFLLGVGYYSNKYFSKLNKDIRVRNYEYCFTESAKLGNKDALESLMNLYPNIENIDGIIIVEAELKKIKEEEKKKEDELKKQKILEEEKIKKEKEEKVKAIQSETLKEVEKMLGSLNEDLSTSELEKRINDIDKYLKLKQYIIDIGTIPNISLLSVAKSNLMKRKYEESLLERERHAKKQIESNKQKEEKMKAFISSLKEKYLNKFAFHEMYGKGIIEDIYSDNTNNAYCKIRFFSKIATFLIPEAFDKGHLNLKNIWAPKPEERQNYKEKEILKEKDYLKKVVDACSYKSQLEYKAEKVNYLYNPLDTEFDPQEVADSQRTAYMQAYWRDVSMTPYFASLDTKIDGLIRIGKAAIDNLVVDWRDRRSSIYYNYNMLVGNEKVGLKLVRDHIIAYQKYKDFVDRFNLEYSDGETIDGINLENTTDKYLSQLLTYFRNSKKTHEIIQTIQSNQYEIISDLTNCDMLVTGCAGSGKTMILFHRIAYLAFNLEDFKPEKYLVLSSSKLLNREADELSNELQINEIKNIDINSFYKEKLNSIIKANNCTYLLKNGLDSQAFNSNLYTIAYLRALINAINKNTIDKSEYLKYRENYLVDCFENIFNMSLPDESRNLNFVNEYFYKSSSKDFNNISEKFSKISKQLLEATSFKDEPNKEILSLFLLKNFSKDLKQNKDLDLSINEIKTLDDFLDAHCKEDGKWPLKYARPGGTEYKYLIPFVDYIKFKEENADKLKEILSYIFCICSGFESFSKKIKGNELEFARNIDSMFSNFDLSKIITYDEKINKRKFKDSVKGLFKKVSSTVQVLSIVNPQIKSDKFLIIIHDYLSNLEDYLELESIIKRTPYDNYKKGFKSDAAKNLIGDLKFLFSKEPIYVEPDLNSFNELYNLVKNEKIINSCLKNNGSCYESLVHLFDCVNFENTKNKIEEVVSKVPIPNLELYYELYFKNKREDLNFIEEYLIRYMSSFGILSQSKQSELQMNIASLPELSKFYSFVDSDTNLATSKLTGVSGKRSLIHILDVLTFEKYMSSFMDYSSGNTEKEFFSICDYCIENMGEKISNTSDHNFLLLYAAINNGFYDNESYDKIFIDEVQNYSIYELEILKKMFSNANFCLLGDFKQRIEEKGFDSFDCLSLDNFKRYDLNVNYRNAKEICDYLNETFKMKMMSVGVPGVVRKEKVNYKISIKNKDDRIAVIGKDASYINEIKTDSKINIVNPDAGRIERGEINFLNISDVKGLEFEAVIVICNGLTKAEKYLACSRALNELIVVE